MQIAVPRSFDGDPEGSRRFRRIVEWAVKKHPFYQDWIRDPSLEVPVIDRATVLKHNDALLNGHEITGGTSGSTSRPLCLSNSEKRQEIERKDTSRLVEWLGGALIRTRIIYPKFELEPDMIHVGDPTKKQIAALEARHRKLGAVAVTTYPSNAERICRYLIDQNRQLPWVQRFGCYAEVFEPAVEEMIRKVFPNAQIWTTYSAQEVGIIGARCPHEPNYYHLMTHKLGVEILDRDGEPCEMGEVGRVVLTDYYNDHLPFIRYEIGDLAARGQCPCNKIDLPALSRVIGKERSQLRNRSGAPILSSPYEAFHRIHGLQQWQVIQHEAERFTIRYSARKSIPSESIEPELGFALTSFLGNPSQITFSRQSALRCTEQGKYYYTICEM